MAEEKVVIPEGMLREAWSAQCSDTSPSSMEDELRLLQVALKAALKWLTENPIVPTHAQGRELLDDIGFGYRASLFPHMFQVMSDWQRRMFLAHEPKREVSK